MNINKPISHSKAVRFTLYLLISFIFFNCTTEEPDNSIPNNVNDSSGTPTSVTTEEETDNSTPNNVNENSGTPTSVATETIASSISVYDGLISFNFPEEYTIGKFANGDYWVHNKGNSVIINNISPASTTNSGRVINGTMLNPENSTTQGYDSKARDMGYDASLNVDPGITGNSLTVPANTSVVKSISMESDAGRPIIKDAVVLTVLSETPPEGAFRPSYTGADKNIIATINDLNYSKLGNHPKLGNEPNITDVQNSFERVWLEHCTEWTQRDIHPENNMPAYGRDLAAKSGEGLVLLQLNFTQQEKETLLIRLVQYGIDLYGVAKNGGVWYNNGGHNLGRKMPLLLAAKVLGNEDMLKYTDKDQHFIFQDDQQHFYVSQTEINITNGSSWNPDTRATTTPYNEADIDIAEWGIRHADRPTADNAHWSATYRHVNGPSQFSHILAAELMEVKDDWNWPPVFDYFKRYYELEKSGNLSSFFTTDLWETYVK